MLCNFCQSIVSADEDRGRRFRSASDIEQAALSNCYFCHWILQKYHAAGNEADTEPADLMILFLFSSFSDREGQLLLRFWISGLPQDFTDWATGSHLKRTRLPKAENRINFALLSDSHTAKAERVTIGRSSQADNWRGSDCLHDVDTPTRLCSNTGH